MNVSSSSHFETAGYLYVCVYHLLAKGPNVFGGITEDEVERYRDVFADTGAQVSVFCSCDHLKLLLVRRREGIGYVSVCLSVCLPRFTCTEIRVYILTTG